MLNLFMFKMLLFQDSTSEMSTVGHLDSPPAHPDHGGVIQEDPWPGRIPIAH